MRWAPAVLVMLVLAGAVLAAVPEARAVLLRVLEVGVVQIFLTAGTPTPTEPPFGTAAPTPTAEVLVPPFDLAGQRNLVEIGQAVDFPLLLPSYPEELGVPDVAFLQNLDGPFVILVWTTPEDPARARLALHILGPGTFAGKGEPRVLAEVEVNGQPALWTEGPHSLLVQSGDYVLRTLVTGNVLIWKDGPLTYRLETDLLLEEAIRIAESLR